MILSLFKTTIPRRRSLNSEKTSYDSDRSERSSIDNRNKNIIGNSSSSINSDSKYNRLFLLEFTISVLLLLCTLIPLVLILELQTPRIQHNANAALEPIDLSLDLSILMSDTDTHKNNDNNLLLCPPLDAATPPPQLPQILSFGNFRNHSGTPYITQDCWADLVDNRRTFFLRPEEKGFPSPEELRNWIRSRPHPITLIMNNQVDRSWPLNVDRKYDYELILNEPNLYALYAGNARKLEKYPKLKPLPIGMKWQFRTTQLFGEKKDQLVDAYSSVSSSPEETQRLFEMENRTSTVWLRPMTDSNKQTTKYLRDNDALKTTRSHICGALKNNAPQSSICEGGNGKIIPSPSLLQGVICGTLELMMRNTTTVIESSSSGNYCDTQKNSIPRSKYFNALKKHRFMISPPGNGLDTHSTWEALLAGCIPIVPRSAINSVFEDLPVWLVDSWDEVTDEAILRVEEEMKQKTYNWKNIFASGWKEEIHKGLCKIS